MSEVISGQEPSVSLDTLVSPSGSEPMLGGLRRARLDPELFWDLLQIDTPTRHEAVDKVIKRSASPMYARAMVAVLSPDARYFKLGYLWKVPYSYFHKLAAMDSLVLLDQPRALSGLILALNHDDLALQQAAISCMARLSSEKAEAAMIAVLQDGRMVLRHAALQALADRWSLPSIRRLANPVPAIVAEAARWLGENEGERVIPALIASVRDRRSSIQSAEIVQAAAVSAMGQIGCRLAPTGGVAAMAAIRTLLDEGMLSPAPARQAIRELVRIGTEDALALAVVYEAANSA